MLQIADDQMKAIASDLDGKSCVSMSDGFAGSSTQNNEFPAEFSK